MKNTKNSIKILKWFFLIIFLWMTSCSTLPEPSDSIKVLLIGQVSVEFAGKGEDFGNGLILKGSMTNEITLYFTNYQTKKVFKVVADESGFFATTVLPEGNYYISNIEIEKRVYSVRADGYNTVKLSTNPSGVTKFVLKPGAVTNLGKIIWSNDEKGIADVTSKEGFTSIKSSFAVLHKDSKWLLQPWTDFKITQHIDFDLNVVKVNENPRVAAADFKDASIERIVRQVPNAILEKQRSNPDEFLKELVAFLSKDSPNNFETVKRLHDWVADNIAYDAPSFLAGRIPDQNYPAVLATKLAVCEGYAVLFKKLCDLKGIPCALVDGYSRGYGSSIFSNEDPSKSNHAWNMVEIEGNDYLVDTTWDSGTLEGGRYSKSYSTGYLFADPKAFICSHYPSNPQYQMLKNPVDAATFVKLPNFNTAYFSSGIDNITKIDKINNWGNDFKLEFKIPDDIEFMAALYTANDNKEVPGSVFKQQTKNICTVFVSLPKPGQYILRLFKHGKDDFENSYPGCGEIGFVADKDSQAQYPRVFSSFLKNYQLLSPLGTPLIPKKEITFKVNLPGVPYAFVVVNNQPQPMNAEANSSIFSLTMTVPESADFLTIAKSQSMQGAGGYETILEFPIKK